MESSRCVVCEGPVAPVGRRNHSLCSQRCAVDALFEVVRLEDELGDDVDVDARGAAGQDDDADGGIDTEAVLALVADHRRLHRRQVLVHAVLTFRGLQSADGANRATTSARPSSVVELPDPAGATRA